MEKHEEQLLNLITQLSKENADLRSQINKITAIVTLSIIVAVFVGVDLLFLII